MMEVTYYPGCSLEGTAREYNESIEAVFKALGIELKELEDWSCCGSSSAHIKDHDLAVSLAARNLELADKVHLDMVVPCAACYQRLKVAEKELLESTSTEEGQVKYSGDIKILHIADFLAEKVTREQLVSRIQKPLKGLKPVSYYGCLTVRPPKITDAGRPEDPMGMDIIAHELGAEVKKWSYKTDCCGGSLTLTRPDIVQRLVRKLLDAAIEAGANCIAASCPMCMSNLDNTQKQLNEETGSNYQIPIVYITEMVGVAFGDKDAEKWLSRHIIDPRPLFKESGLI